MKAVVLAGGLGTRLREAVPDLPKPMAPVAGRPFLAYLLDVLIRDGFSDIVLSVGYRWEVIRGHFGASYDGAAISCAVEGEPLGTGGAIAHAFASAGIDGSEAALVLNGDTFLDLDFTVLRAWYAQKPVACAMVLRQGDDTARYASVAVAVAGGSMRRYRHPRDRARPRIFWPPTAVAGPARNPQGKSASRLRSARHALTRGFQELAPDSRMQVCRT